MTSNSQHHGNLDRFLHPTPEFWEWLQIAARNRMVVDIGTGRGDLLLECQEHGLRAMGIDPCYDYFGEPVPQVLMNSLLPLPVEECMDTVEADDVLLLCCRPCHDGFPRDVVEAKRKSPFFYIGFEKNLSRDLGDVHLFPVAHKGRLLVAGAEGERVWEVGPKGT